MATPLSQQPPPHLCFGMNTLSFLYSSDLRLLEVRSVPLEKLFCLGISPDKMQFVHDQVGRVTCSMLDSAFVFVEKVAQQGGASRVQAYCLSHPSWGAGAAASMQEGPSAAIPSYADTPSSCTPASAASSASTLPAAASAAKCRKTMAPPTVSDLRKHGFMRRIEDEAEVCAAFERFRHSPMAAVACESDELAAIQRAGDSGRRVVISMDCTLASYAERFATPSDAADDPWMGQMLLEGVVNFPLQRCFVPTEVCDCQTLIDCFMQNIRVFNVHVQHNSRLLLRRSSCGTSHRFSECNLCNPVASYESMGWAGRYFQHQHEPCD